MILFFSGGSPIVETTLPRPNVMLSYYVDVKPKTGKTSKRMQELMRLRAKAKKKPNPPACVQQPKKGKK